MDVRFFCSMFPKSTHETFAQKLYQTFKNSKRFTKPKLSRTSFAISHYAGEVKHLSHAYNKFYIFFLLTSSLFYWMKQVTYQADLFLDKNKDYVVAEHQDLLIASRCTFVAGLFPRLAEESSSKTKFSSIGSRFKVWWSVIDISLCGTCFLYALRKALFSKTAVVLTFTL